VDFIVAVACLPTRWDAAAHSHQATNLLPYFVPGYDFTDTAIGDCSCKTQNTRMSNIRYITYLQKFYTPFDFLSDFETFHEHCIVIANSKLLNPFCYAYIGEEKEDQPISALVPEIQPHINATSKLGLQLHKLTYLPRVMAMNKLHT